ncbi:CLB4 [Cyberlindnera jadinii]|uniref:A/B/D/E cyclin n=1 Tax=Cyberlindnera jadinii (strain ATCC 18201 / CBS 1600 / BCRC 20928 / JCM 3617 / NBRC 0987 / NRRL Y-1542) TaxID=983966 RepID=A0A0H5CAJ5_CYBJN|nr:A/B/D/E cyclin [Cyberlindnera jadinii NRRL Y-1542]ODV76068.1 A/B/D/E cyclin [Cyberlindnera jadinii NRRL Y-1542]CEP20754.1 CLB4 [Cyberlindnera jadinii]
MERANIRYTNTNENSDALKHKVSRVSQNQPIQTTRSALSDVSTSHNALRARPGLDKPAQRVQVYKETDENDVPKPVSKYEAPDHNRQPLAEIQTRQTPYAAENSYIEESSFVEEEDEEEEAEAMPQPMMPILNERIHRELYEVHRLFYSDQLDPTDEDTFDVSMVAEYAPEIFNYFHKLEMKLRPHPSYMEFQTELKWDMRGILIDWLVQVHSRFNLLPETLFLTVNYIDRFLSKRKVSLNRFQLVGAVALFIAAKYEEINCPGVQEIAYMVDHAYSVDDILRAERFMIDVLEFEMGWPGPMSFLRRTSKADDYDFETRTLAKYFLEITIMDYRFVASPPSWLAAGAHFLSRLLLNRGEWTPAHVYYSGYTAEQLRPLATALLESCRKPEDHHKAIFEKYQERRYRRSSLFVQEWFKLAEAED